LSAPAWSADRASLDTSVLIATDVAPIPGVLAISSISLAEPQLGVMDRLIAATAHAQGTKLYTHNPEGFAGLENLVEVVTAKTR
jgi:predicted nucleic acid-binding protein